MAEAILRIFRGTREGGEPVEYRVPVATGMVVLDALHYVQKHQAPDLAVRWNCKAGKCGSCSAEVNGRPRLTCKTRMDTLPQDKPITIFPMKAFPVIKDLVTDVSWNYKVNKKIPPFQPRSFATTASRRNSAAHVSSCALQAWRCIRSTASPVLACSKTNLDLVCAILRSAAPRFALRQFASPITQSFL